jgi:hypothetical protein
MVSARFQAGGRRRSGILTSGAHLSLTGEGERLTPLGFWSGGPWASFGPGPEGSPRGPSLFLFRLLLFFFCLLISFLDFAY